MNTTDHGPPATQAGTVLRTRWRKNRTPIEAAFDRLCANPRLGSDAKVLAGQLLPYCLAERNVACFPSTLELAQHCGWSGLYQDRGKAKVFAALAELERERQIARLSPGRFWLWFKAEGSPKFAVIKPNPKYGCRRFILLLWKFLEDQPNLGSQLAEGSASATLEGPEGSAGATLEEAPAQPLEVAPAQPVQNPSKVEPFEATRNSYVTARPLEDQKLPASIADPPVTFTAADVAGWLEDLKIPERHPMRWKRLVALVNLDQAGQVPPEWREKVPARESPTDLGSPRPRTSAGPAVVLTPSELLENRVRRLAQGGPSLPDEAIIKDLAFDVAYSIIDAHSLELHEAVLRDVAAKKIPIAHYLIAFKRGRSARPGEGGAAFTKFIQPYRPGWKRKTARRL